MDLSKFTTDSKFLMLALDHRGSFKKLINPSSPDAVSEGRIIELKFEIIEALKDQLSALLIDVEYGLKAYSGRTKPFLLPLEKSGFKEEDSERITEIEHFSKQLGDFGASGVKLLLYFNPHLSSSKKQVANLKQALEDARSENLPLFLEIVTYVTAGKIEEQREKLILDSLHVFNSLDLKPDVWKLEYPGSLEGCQKINDLAKGIPWILLTRGDSFETFLAELKVAVKAGCSGFLAGRALWQEVCQMTGNEREKFLNITLPERFKQIADVTS